MHYCECCSASPEQGTGKNVKPHAAEDNGISAQRLEQSLRREQAEHESSGNEPSSLPSAPGSGTPIFDAVLAQDEDRAEYVIQRIGTSPG